MSDDIESQKPAETEDKEISLPDGETTEAETSAAVEDDAPGEPESEEAPAPEAAPAQEDTRPKPPEIGKGGVMRIRSIAFNRRKVLRVIQPFEHDGVKYERGQIFDWAVLGIKPIFVRRLYNRKAVRHVVEDAKVAYPFRALRRDESSALAPAVTAETEKGAQATAGEAGNNAPEATKGKETPPDGKPAAKFTKKNAHKR